MATGLKLEENTTNNGYQFLPVEATAVSTGPMVGQLTGNGTTSAAELMAVTRGSLPPSSEASLGSLSLLFCTVGLVGLLGNILVIYIILSDKKMRRGVTNLFIMNLAIADLSIMLFGVPEIVLFMINRGWLLSVAMCKFQRYSLTVSLYVSIMTLVAVCIERYIAIVHPIKAHIFCSRRRIVIAICCIWPTALVMGLPVAVFNQVARPHHTFPVELCLIMFPGNHKMGHLIFKWVEFSAFFLVPVVLQVVMYTIISRRLFASTSQLHRKQMIREQDGGHKQKDSDAIKARKGVVKMLIASVVVYFLSYAPAQVPLFYNLISSVPFRMNWSFLVLLMTMGYINSAANPILYGIFSQNFRRRFSSVLCRCVRTPEYKYKRTTSTTMDSYVPPRSVRFNSLKTNMTSLSEV